MKLYTVCNILIYGSPNVRVDRLGSVGDMQYEHKDGNDQNPFCLPEVSRACFKHACKTDDYKPKRYVSKFSRLLHAVNLIIHYFSKHNIKA